MAKGLPKSIIKKYGISKKAWSVFRGRKGKKRTGSTRRSSNPKRSVRKTARRYTRKRRRRSSGMTIPIAPVAGLIAGLGPAIEEGLKGNFNGVVAHLSMGFTGYDPNAKNWDPTRMVGTVVPIVAGLLVHKFVGGPPLNFNKLLGRAKVPFIRI